MSMATTKHKRAKPAAGGLRLGLCCQFAAEPIKFRTTTATAMATSTARFPSGETTAEMSQ